MNMFAGKRNSWMIYIHIAIHIHNGQLASSLSSSTVCGVVLECGCEYYGSNWLLHLAAALCVVLYSSVAVNTTVAASTLLPCWFRGTAGHLMKMRDCPSKCGTVPPNAGRLTPMPPTSWYSLLNFKNFFDKICSAILKKLCLHSKVKLMFKLATYSITVATLVNKSHEVATGGCVPVPTV